MPTTMFAYLAFDDAHLVADHLARDEHITVTTHPERPNHSFNRCTNCHDGLGVLEWSWDIWDSNADGRAETCTDWGCVDSVLSEAREDGSDDHRIVVEYPHIPRRNETVAAA